MSSPIVEIKASSVNDYEEKNITIEDYENLGTENFEQGTFYTIDEICPSLDQRTKDIIERETWEYLGLNAKDNISTFSVDDGRYLKTKMGELSPQEVRDLNSKKNTTEAVVGLIIGYMSAPAGSAWAIANLIMGDPIETAARNGWGLEIYFIADKYNPTSGGMRWKYEYVK